MVNRLGSCIQGEGNILITWPHRVGTEMDVVHSKRVGLFPVLAGLNPDQFSLGAHVAPRQKDGGHKDRQELFHGLVFLQSC